MKYIDFHTESNKITFCNSIFGVETITVNGVQVSKKFSFNGTLHKFSINNKEFNFISEYVPFNNKGIKLELYEGKQLIETKVSPNKKQLLFWGVLGYFMFKILLNS